ncbi:hypothetical protein C8R44DRAFT_810779 [Mycena epipterygia]|nr:hypothetical protein C8R44DRAFT_810779 [Mycena epipterygia]
MTIYTGGVLHVLSGSGPCGFSQLGNSPRDTWNGCLKTFNLMKPAYATSQSLQTSCFV